MRKYVTVEKKLEWKEFWCACSKLDPPNNEINYELWVSHMSSGDQVVTINRSRDLLLEKIRAVKDELGIGHFMKTVQPVEVSQSTPDHSSKHGHAHAQSSSDPASTESTEENVSVGAILKERMFPSTSSFLSVSSC
jgi:hypothetical protein